MDIAVVGFQIPNRNFLAMIVFSCVLSIVGKVLLGFPRFQMHLLWAWVHVSCFVWPLPVPKNLQMLPVHPRLTTSSQPCLWSVVPTNLNSRLRFHCLSLWCKTIFCTLFWGEMGREIGHSTFYFSSLSNFLIGKTRCCTNVLDLTVVLLCNTFPVLGSRVQFLTLFEYIISSRHLAHSFSMMETPASYE